MPPPTDQQRNRRLAFVMGGLALVVSAVGAFVFVKGTAPVHEVTDAEGLAAIEPPAFVRMRVTPRLDSLGHLMEGAQSSFLVQTEEGVLLYASAGTDLARRLPGPGGEVLGPPITVEGSCYALGDYPRLTSQLPGYLIDEYAEEHALPPTTRVIEIDHGPGAVMMIGALPIGCCALPLLALAGFALVKSRKA